MLFEPSLLPENRYSATYVYSSKSGRDEVLDISIGAIRFSEPDIVVVAGSGKKKRTFQCHRAILSLASEKLESMIVKSSKKLLLPHVNPEAWAMFYTCIHPSQNGCILNEENVKVVTPLIQQFIVLDYVALCIDILNRLCWDCNKSPSIQFMVDLLKFTIDHRLAKAQRRTENLLSSLIGDEDDDLICYANSCYEFNVNAVNDMVSLCLPLKKSNVKGTYTPSNCHIVWEAISNCIADPMKSFTFDKVDTSECELFANLIYHLLCSESYRRRHTTEDQL
jgi:hypothetical protein